MITKENILIILEIKYICTMSHTNYAGIRSFHKFVHKKMKTKMRMIVILKNCLQQKQKILNSDWLECED